MTARYVTLAHGESDAISRQATMLVLSLLAYAPEPREIVVITDHPERFQWLRDVVRLHAVGGEQLEAWRGASPFSMRQKLEAALASAPSEGALIFLDADTIARGELTPLVETLSGGALLMHTREFELGASRRSGNRALWRQLRGRTFGGWEFRPDDAMWNSGVLALPARDIGLLREALSLYDDMAAAGIRHFATEQLVVGLVLGRTGRLRESSRWFTHYWGNKENFDREIRARLDGAQRASLTPAAAAEAFRQDPIRLPAEERPGKIDKLRRWWSGRRRRR